MNKVILVRNVLPEMYGGGETYQLKIAYMLKKYGFQPIILSSSLELIRKAKANGFDTIKAPFLKNQNWSGVKNFLLPFYWFKIIRLRKWYRNIFRKYRPSVVNIQSRDDWIAATKIAKKMGIKVLWTDHMDFRSWVLTNVKVWYKNWIGKWVLKCAKMADQIIMISDFEKKYFDYLTKSHKFSNVVVIKNGVNDEKGRYKDVRVQGGNFLYLGRVVDYKGIKELIEAFIMVLSIHPEARLNVYGDGDISVYAKMCKKRSEISFYGRTSEPIKVLAENDVFVLPSYREGLSLSLLDAIMMGKKIIASDVDGNPEVITNGETGLLVPIKNKKALFEAMIWMLDNRKKAGIMASNARQRYEEQFDLEMIFKKQMLPLYYNITRKGNDGIVDYS